GVAVAVTVASGVSVGVDLGAPGVGSFETSTVVGPTTTSDGAGVGDCRLARPGDPRTFAVEDARPIAEGVAPHVNALLAGTLDSSVLPPLGRATTIAASAAALTDAAPAILAHSGQCAHHRRRSPMATAAASSRVATPSFERICETWYFAPSSEMLRRWAISSFVKPWPGGRGLRARVESERRVGAYSLADHEIPRHPH